jgi:hypothetical protein
VTFVNAFIAIKRRPYYVLIMYSHRCLLHVEYHMAPEPLPASLVATFDEEAEESDVDNLDGL